MDYTSINDAWRSVGNKLDDQPAKCDNAFSPGWYRFIVNGTHYKLPTYCPSPSNNQPKICGTHAPVWFNGRALVVINEIQIYEF